MPKIICKVKNEAGNWEYIKDENGKKKIFPSFKKAQEAACPDFHPNGQRRMRAYSSKRIDIPCRS